ncbi:GNAT family N-acetyltransferase [Staphylococcus equorum]|uniref:GNAT family N-acetyltransferase n=1 Tax=Staphylococcus equorum TaxID=246432 RepID=A0A9X4LBE8_9STAP|nr:N-acetyltransferase [Staphylococcus equorum]MDG0844251.1 GNAT family N-acetyltransferase [Staphylococcus equorum]MDG0860059.1 GNAT family N-acetyltransferase [Staphylococcus equorum]
MDFRYLSEADVSQYRLLRLNSLQTDPNGFASTYDREIEFPIETFKVRLENIATHFTMGVFDDGTLICIATFYSEVLEKIKHKGNLVSVYCHPQYRRQGIAKQLIQQIIDSVIEQNTVKTINLCVLSENKSAISLYKKLGFKRYGTEPKALYDGHVYYDEDLMCLEL